MEKISVFQIRMDPDFFADPDPGFKSPDPSINKLMGSKWWFWWGFGGAWPKRTVLRVLDMKYNIFFYFYSSFRTCFSRIRIIRLDPDFWSIRIREKKNKNIRNTVQKSIKYANTDPEHHEPPLKKNPIVLHPIRCRLFNSVLHSRSVFGSGLCLRIRLLRWESGS